MPAIPTPFGLRDATDRVAVSGPARLLLVEDDPGLRRSLQILLEDEGGWSVAVAPSVDAATAALRVCPETRVVVSDFALGEVDGLELLRQVRAKWPHIAFILITAFPSARLRAEASRLGAAAFLTKPIDPDALLETARRAQWDDTGGGPAVRR